MMLLHEEELSAAVQSLLSKAKGAKAIRLKSSRQPGTYTIVSREPSENSTWRVSVFDQRGALGHYPFKTLDEGLRSFSGDWFKGPPHAPFGDFVFETGIYETGQVPSIGELDRRIQAKERVCPVYIGQ